MLRLHLYIITAIVGAITALGCAMPLDEDAPEPVPTADPADGLVIGEFMARVNPATRQFAIERVERDATPSLTPQSADELTITQDGVPGSGPANTVELVTNSVTFGASCPGGSAASWCANITLRSFLGRPLPNVYVLAASVKTAAGTDVSADHGVTNNDALPSNYVFWSQSYPAHIGRWQYTGSGASTNGVLGASGASNAGAKDWVFADPDGLAVEISLKVVATLTYATYTRGTSSVSYIDACAQAGTIHCPKISAPCSINLPFGFTFYDTAAATALNLVQYGHATFGNVAVAGGANVDLPDNTLASPKPGIFSFWDNLDYTSSSDSEMCAWITGSEPNRQAHLTWRKMRIVTGGSDSDDLSFTVTLLEGSERVHFIYSNMTSTDQPAANGGGATIGLQNASGDLSTIGDASIGATLVTNSGMCSLGTNCLRYVFRPVP